LIKKILEGGVMVGKILKYLAGMFLIVLLLSCTKIPEPIESNLGMQELSLGDTIPAQWGNLVAVTSANEYATYVQLWFQDKDGNVYVVGYNVSKNKFSLKFRSIKRK
jgi:hypothetical protein